MYTNAMSSAMLPVLSHGKVIQVVSIFIDKTLTTPSS